MVHHVCRAGKPIPGDIAHLTDIHDMAMWLMLRFPPTHWPNMEFIGDAKVVAHCAEFDRTFTTRHPSGCSCWKYGSIRSILRESRPLCMKSHRLLDLVRAFGAPLSTHRADADVEATCAILPHPAGGRCDDTLPALVCEIAHMATPDEWSTRMVFRAVRPRYEVGSEPRCFIEHQV